MSDNGEEARVARKIFGSIVIILLLLYLLTLVLHISDNYEKYLWDFQTHREAGKIFGSGSNPYDAENLPPNVRTHFLYTYPPVTLFFYQAFSWTNYKTAAHIFLIVKCILLIGLVYFWKREFLKDDADPFFYIFCLLVFNSAVFIDMIAGNINLIEQVILWLAFSFYIKKRPLPFCIFVLIAASFKMTPAFFLILLMLSDDANKYKYFGGAAAAFLSYLLIQYVILPEYFAGFIKNALTVVGETGMVVPSTLKFVGDFFKALGVVTGIVVPKSFQLLIVGLIVSGIVYLTYRAVTELKRSKMPSREKIEVFLICVLYALIHPRMKDYMYLLLIVPSYYIIKNTRFTRLAPFLFILFILSSERLALPIFSSVMSLIWAYYPLMIAYCVWGVFLYEIFNYKNAPAASGTPHEKKTKLG